MPKMTLALLDTVSGKMLWGLDSEILTFTYLGIRHDFCRLLFLSNNLDPDQAQRKSFNVKVSFFFY